MKETSWAYTVTANIFCQLTTASNSRHSIICCIHTHQVNLAYVSCTIEQCYTTGSRRQSTITTSFVHIKLLRPILKSTSPLKQGKYRKEITSLMLADDHESKNIRCSKWEHPMKDSAPTSHTAPCEWLGKLLQPLMHVKCLWTTEHASPFTGTKLHNTTVLKIETQSNLLCQPPLQTNPSPKSTGFLRNLNYKTL